MKPAATPRPMSWERPVTPRPMSWERPVTPRPMSWERRVTPRRRAGAACDAPADELGAACDAPADELGAACEAAADAPEACDDCADALGVAGFGDGVLPPPVEHAPTSSASSDAPRASVRTLRMGTSYYDLQGTGAPLRVRPDYIGRYVTSLVTDQLQLRCVVRSRDGTGYAVVTGSAASATPPRARSRSRRSPVGVVTRWMRVKPSSVAIARAATRITPPHVWPTSLRATPSTR